MYRVVQGVLRDYVEFMDRIKWNMHLRLSSC